ncbi:SRPBCC domain-containing protein [Streptomyces albus]|uniref:Activator of Hsp90 ATPase homologue 1/2-like C-terminal domain-containing protein n=1 Tax=Streptomyces albus TaxID=1888 RepID=A0A8H1LBR1_9ACTN|nr:SRPBCC domain-containing protein [Streptomyces albus]TGG80892.1 hypothetical protein D8771_20440 [Streptomyces albus]UVN55438.1 SRPBCC domain-containing protein [Streptomyces albus]
MNTDSQAPVPGGVPYGTARSSADGAAHTVGFELTFPHPLESVWAAVATPAGLRGWLAAADRFEPGPGGAVTLRWRDGAPDGGPAPAPGRITAWSRRRLAEYTVDARGSFGFTLRGALDDDRTRVRFRNDFTGDAEHLLDALADWHQHFELLSEELYGRPVDWAAWTPERFAELRAQYAARV